MEKINIRGKEYFCYTKEFLDKMLWIIYSIGMAIGIAIGIMISKTL